MARKRSDLTTEERQAIRKEQLKESDRRRREKGSAAIVALESLRAQGLDSLNENGESKFDSAVLNDLIAQTKDKIQFSSEAVDRYQSELSNQQQYLTGITPIITN